jgi:hypothetical protein
MDTAARQWTLLFEFAFEFVNLPRRAGATHPEIPLCGIEG